MGVYMDADCGDCEVTAAGRCALCRLLVWAHLPPFYSRLKATSPACEFNTCLVDSPPRGSPNISTNFNHPVIVSMTNCAAVPWSVEDFSSKACKRKLNNLNVIVPGEHTCLCLELVSSSNGSERCMLRREYTNQALPFLFAKSQSRSLKSQHMI